MSSNVKIWPNDFECLKFGFVLVFFQSTSYHIWCKMTAISLYYLHVATLLWFLLSSVYSVQIVRQSKTPTRFYIFCICGWVVPLVITSVRRCEDVDELIGCDYV